MTLTYIGCYHLPVKYALLSTGCRSNQYDSWVIDSHLRERGFVPSSPEAADFVIINACTVTEGAERELRRIISRIRRLPGSKKKIVITGCHAQVYPFKDYGAELVLGQREKFSINDLLSKNGRFVGDIGDSIDEIPSMRFLGPRTRFFFKIQDGCDRFCTYCVVPYARGVPRSRPLSEILEFLRELKDLNVKEVVLCGIEIASYRDPVRGYDLKRLLEILEDSETPERIRLSSIDPLFIDEEFIRILSKSKKICRSIHIPLQSASDRILSRMGRSYRSSEVREILDELDSKVEGIGIGLDIICGFPGESEDDFLQTLKFVESSPVYYLHVFPFSPREGVEAARFGSKVDEAEKKRRVRILRELDRKLRERFFTRHIGQRLEVLLEKKVYDGSLLKGYTSNYIPVHVPYSSHIVNELVDVEIERVIGGKVLGRIEKGRSARAECA